MCLSFTCREGQEHGNVDGQGQDTGNEARLRAHDATAGTLSTRDRGHGVPADGPRGSRRARLRLRLRVDPSDLVLADADRGDLEALPLPGAAGDRDRTGRG